jgi:hypothetical protein
LYAAFDQKMEERPNEDVLEGLEVEVEVEVLLEVEVEVLLVMIRYDTILDLPDQ